MPHDVAASVLYFASEEASFVTGQTLSVNGGNAVLRSALSELTHARHEDRGK
jgi:3-oxoacyl-[acyl-carrier protein] reductase